MKHYSWLVLLAAVACHTDSAVAPIVTPPTPGNVKDMQAGEVRVLTPAQAPNGLEFTGAAAISHYLLVVGNTNPTLDVVSDFVVKGDLAAQGGRAALAGVPPVRSAISRGEVDRQAEAEAVVRSFERSHLHPARAHAALSGMRARRSVSLEAVPVEGQVLTLHVPNEDASNLCNSFATVQAVVKKVGAHAVLLLDKQAQASFTSADYTAMAAEFDNITYPTDSSYFGNPTDIDNNDRILMLFTPEVNKLTPPGESSFIAGFFFAGDLFPSTGQNACAESNEAEIFYLLAPDPTGEFHNPRSTESVRQGTRGTIAHEFQHMINAGNRIVFDAPAFEAVWLDEGLSHTAEDAVGRAVRNFGDFETLTDALLFESGNQAVIDDYNAFFFQNLARLHAWMIAPERKSPLSAQADSSLAARGAIWSLLRWTVDQYSNDDARGFFRRLAAGPDTGVKNLTLRANAPIDSLVAGWLTTNYTDHLGIANLPAKYNYRGYNMRSAEPGAFNGSYPLDVTTLLAGANASASVRSGSGSYYLISVPANAPRTVKVENPGGANLSFPGAHYYVVRID